MAAWIRGAFLFTIFGLATFGQAQILPISWRDEGTKDLGGVAIDLAGGYVATRELAGTLKIWKMSDGSFVRSITTNYVANARIVTNNAKTVLTTWDSKGLSQWAFPSITMTVGQSGTSLTYGAGS